MQLATAAGYEVFITAYPGNIAYLKRLGTSQAFDYRSPNVIRDINLALDRKFLAGALVIGNIWAESCIAVLEKAKRRKFFALAGFPTPGNSSRRLWTEYGNTLSDALSSLVATIDML